MPPMPSMPPLPDASASAQEPTTRHVTLSLYAQDIWRLRRLAHLRYPEDRRALSRTLRDVILEAYQRAGAAGALGASGSEGR